MHENPQPQVGAGAGRGREAAFGGTQRKGLSGGVGRSERQTDDDRPWGEEKWEAFMRESDLRAARFGVWSFHHDDEEKYRGAPPAFCHRLNGGCQPAIRVLPGGPPAGGGTGHTCEPVQAPVLHE